ncbi:MAG: hypothetical protein QNK23_06615 [Crocinitomicaceae bacterium]|nr:hypothetical protein [Crocinitomicaceae bacterium]
MKYLLFTLVCIGLISCKSDAPVTEAESGTETENSVDSTIVEPTTNNEDLVEIEGDLFTEYYPGKLKIKFQGTQDENGQRHGKWLYFSEEGEELSMTMYEHGNFEGHIMVKYPNGVLRYVGEYSNNQPVGVWKRYSQEGILVYEGDYGYPE